MKWKVKVARKCEKEIGELLKNNKLTQNQINIIREWIEFVECYGPYELEKYEDYKFNPHNLDRDWTGYHASSFSYSGRIIYKIKDRIVTVEVVRITPDHNYKKEK